MYDEQAPRNRVKGVTVAGIRKSYFIDNLTSLISSVFEQPMGDDIKVGVTTGDEDNLIIEIVGLTIDENGDITTKERDFDFEGTVTFTVTGTVTARSNDEAREFVEELLADATVSLEDEDFIDYGTVTDSKVEWVY